MRAGNSAICVSTTRAHWPNKLFIFFFKQKTAYEIHRWSSDVCSSDLLSIIDRLRAKGADVRYHDPFVKQVRFDDAHTEGSGEPLQSVPLTDGELQASDCVVIVTNHSRSEERRVGKEYRGWR